MGFKTKKLCSIQSSFYFIKGKTLSDYDHKTLNQNHVLKIIKLHILKQVKNVVHCWNANAQTSMIASLVGTEICVLKFVLDVLFGLLTKHIIHYVVCIKCRNLQKYGYGNTSSNIEASCSSKMPHAPLSQNTSETAPIQPCSSHQNSAFQNCF